VSSLANAVSKRSITSAAAFATAGSVVFPVTKSTYCTLVVNSSATEMPELATSYRVAAMDQRGYNDSDKPKGQEQYDIALKDSFDVINLAALIQSEAKLDEDFYKVSRVFQNRLDIGMMLQSDATVNYGTNGKTVTTTDAQRADKSPYNTYVYTGLPAGPISNPGELAIEAAIRPGDGDWLFFVTVNLKTGETKFSVTLAEHERAAQEFYAWLRENPEWND
jgi:uncharacterized YceG family protein